MKARRLSRVLRPLVLAKATNRDPTKLPLKPFLPKGSVQPCSFKTARSTQGVENISRPFAPFALNAAEADIRCHLGRRIKLTGLR